MNVLLLRFDAPLMSFGGVMVDQHGPTERFPGLSMLAGIFANALGFRHSDAEKIEQLQNRIEYAARWDCKPESIIDYNTVDLARPKMIGYADINKKSDHGGWTTRGNPEHRTGGEAARLGTHIRFRHFWAGGAMTLAVTLMGEEYPNIQSIEAAMKNPARPIFIGRKTCLPASPLFVDKIEATSVLEALLRVPQMAQSGRPVFERDMEACWPVQLGERPDSRTVEIYDRRDWKNQIHTGRRMRIEGLIREEAK